MDSDTHIQALNLSLTKYCYFVTLGETGLGKSTLMDTLFNTKFEGEPTQHNQPGVQLKSNTYELQESNVRLKLTIVNTVGFGDQINKEDRCDLFFSAELSNENIRDSLKIICREAY